MDQIITMAAAIDTCFISSGCNRTPHCADWGINNRLAFGSCNSIAICRPETSAQSGSILQTLTCHTDRVNCVQWIKTPAADGETELVSGSVDKTVVVWEIQDKQFKVQQKLCGHTGPVTAVSACYHGNVDQGPRLCQALVVSASVDSTVKIWLRDPGKDFQQLQSISYGSGFALDISLVMIPNTACVMLACACDDQKVHVFIRGEEQEESKQPKFVPCITLPGHEDWVRAVDFTIDVDGDILLASAAQDYLIRVWRFSARTPDSLQQASSVLDLPMGQDIQMRENTFSFRHGGASMMYAVSLETVLSGHENWIYTVKWKPPSSKGGTRHQEMCLLSVSMDKTMILWSPEEQSGGVWMEQVRVGEVGGNTLGLYGGMFGPGGDTIFAHGYQGAFHQWTNNKELGIWDHCVTVSGHFDSVEDIAWDIRGGNFLLSCSLDETVRLHAPWTRDNGQVSWFEIARPQVHGYALQCIAMVTRYTYASGADEKVLRVFDAPDNFVENFCNLCGVDLTEERQNMGRSRPVGASVPALGLSNKAVFADGAVDLTSDMEIKPSENEQYSDNVFTQVKLKAPPTEEHLLQNSLWPEVAKLYGHGYEIFALACDPQGTVLASTCKAAKAEFASVILWDTVTWQQQCTLDGHSLTVTHILFSHTGEYLLTVSRDRTWYLYKRRSPDAPQTDPLFSLLACVDKKTCVHARIIWACSWTHDDRYFLTASRDKKVCIWNRPSSPSEPIQLAGKLDVPDSATAVDAAPVHIAGNSYLVSVGLDNGTILLYKWEPEVESPWKQMAVLDNNLAHHLTVKRLKFRPCLGLAGIHGNKTSERKDSEDWLQLASCSADHSVKVYNICLPRLVGTT